MPDQDGSVSPDNHQLSCQTSIAKASTPTENKTFVDLFGPTSHDDSHGEKQKKKKHSHSSKVSFGQGLKVHDVQTGNIWHSIQDPTILQSGYLVWNLTGSAESPGFFCAENRRKADFP